MHFDIYFLKSNSQALKVIYSKCNLSTLPIDGSYIGLLRSLLLIVVSIGPTRLASGGFSLSLYSYPTPTSSRSVIF